MPRKTRTQKLFAPLLRRNPDVTVVGRFLVPSPLRHSLSAILLDVVGIAGLFRPRSFSFPAFAMPPVFQLNDLENFGWRYYREETFKLPGEELAEQVSTDVEAAVLPTFRALASFDHLYEHAMSGPLRVWVRHNLHFRLELAMGNLDAARMLRSWHCHRWEAPIVELDENFDLELKLCRLLDAGDTAEIGVVLRGEESRIFRAYGVEHLWEPTPFPFEK